MTQQEFELIIRSFDKKVSRRINRLIARIMRLYNSNTVDIKLIYNHAKLINSKRLDDYTKKRIEEAVKELYDTIKQEIEKAAGEVATMTGEQNFTLSKSIYGKAKIPAKSLFIKGSINAVRSFLNRKDYGIPFSKRIWRQRREYRRRIEQAMIEGLKKGTPAKTIAKEILSSHKINAHGKGIYNDPRKNAERLAATEVNKAYQYANWKAWKDDPRIKGIKVQLSNNHPIYDICDELEGVYPKDFLFAGWHPNCRCVAVPVLISERERSLHEDYLLGLRKEPPQIKYVTQPPKKFNEWLEKHSERIKGWKNTPDWIINNAKYVNL